MNTPTPTTENYTGKLPAGWAGGHYFSKWWRGKIIHLYTLRKPCAECGSEMRIDVTKGAIEGTVKNAGLHLKRCAVCRAKTQAAGTSSRPTVEGEQVRLVIEPNDAEQLRTANATMREELKGLYAQNKELRARLSRYELAPALEAVAGAANGTKRMPWES